MWKVLYQISSALKELHNCSKDGSKSVLHRDLKPANVFLDVNNNCKLGDFGLARVLKHDTSFAKTYVGTPYYMSPVSVIKFCPHTILSLKKRHHSFSSHIVSGSTSSLFVEFACCHPLPHFDSMILYNKQNILTQTFNLLFQRNFPTAQNTMKNRIFGHSDVLCMRCVLSFHRSWLVIKRC